MMAKSLTLLFLIAVCNLDLSYAFFEGIYCGVSNCYDGKLIDVLNIIGNTNSPPLFVSF